MADERPVALKVLRPRKAHRRSDVDRSCVIHSGTSNTTSDTVVKPLTESTWTRIKDVARQRQACEDTNLRLDQICKQIPVAFNDRLHGFHRCCYQTFTNTKYLRKRQTSGDVTNDMQPSTSKRSRSETSTVLLPSDKCLFCGQQQRWVSGKGKGKREQLTKCVTETAEASIKEAANAKQDTKLLCIIQDVDLIAREAHYHNSCRRNFTRKDIRNPTPDPNSETSGQIQAHETAFEHLCEYVQTNIIIGSQVERMTMLRERYCLYMQEHSLEHYNPQYKTDKLKDKLQKHFGHRIKFWRPNYRSELVYSDEVPIGQAVEAAFESAASEERRLEETANILRRCIVDAQTNSAEMPWPPSTNFLLSETIKPPDELMTFVTQLLSGRAIKDASTKTERITRSVAQDICYAVSGGRWKMPKHLLLGMTVRHITGSAEIVSLLNRFGHCVSYTTLLELETAMCNAIVETDKLLPVTIDPDKNVVTHFCWDNFDLNEETPSGAGTTHSTHGIVVQETTEECTPAPTVPVMNKTKRRSVDYRPQELEPCFVKQHVEPQLTIVQTSIAVPDVVQQTSMSDFLWIFCRAGAEDGQQTIPGWAGWVSATADSPPIRQSTVDYMAPVNSSITENSTVQHVLHVSQSATRSVKQPYTIVTFDLAVAKKAYAQVWHHSLRYQDVIVRLGVFHTICSYLGALGKLLRGSGFADIVIESGVCASGSIERVLTGKHYNRAMRVHKLTLEALERLLFDAFRKETDAQALIEVVHNATSSMMEEPTSENMQGVTANESCRRLFEKLCTYKDKVRNGELGKTAQFWIQYMDRIWLVLRFLRATKENNLDLHLACVQELCPLLFSMDHHNYARYLSVYLLTLINLPHTHPGADTLLRKCGFSVSRSDVPASRNPVDLTIEQTINRHAKSRGGIIGFSRNFPAYYRWCVTRHVRASYVDSTLDMAGMTNSEESAHKDIRPSEMRRSEADLQILMTSFKNFVNPFEVEIKESLFCLSSGAQAPVEVASDLLKAESIGKQAFGRFVQERLIEKSLKFHAPLRRQSLKTWASLEKKKTLHSSKMKVVQVTAQRNLFGQLLILSEENNLSLQKVLEYPLSPVPWALATPDGLPAKTDKAKLMHRLEDETAVVDHPKLEELGAYIVDGNALLQSLIALPQTFGELSEKVFSVLPKVKRLDFVTDTYKDNSIKAAERSRRGTSESYLVKGPSTKLPKEWKSFLSNNDNKTNLIKLLLSEWRKEKYAAQLVGRHVFFVSCEECVTLTSTDGITVECIPVPSLSSSQEEADTRILLHCFHVATSSTADIIVRSPDTDVFMLLLYYGNQLQQNVYFDTGVSNKRRILDITFLINLHGAQMCSALLALHVFSGCDTTSAFIRKGKITVKKVFEKYTAFLDVFKTLGETDSVTEDCHSELERFVCCLYGKPAYTDVNKLRHDMTRQKFVRGSGPPLSSYGGIDLSLLPPCRSSLRMHILRVNYQTRIWKNAHLPHPDIPSPVGHGWRLDETGNLTYEWTRGDIMPQELVDILSESAPDANDTDDEEDNIQVNSLADVIYDDDDDADDDNQEVTAY
jgi:hypothetical protein